MVGTGSVDEAGGVQDNAWTLVDRAVARGVAQVVVHVAAQGHRPPKPKVLSKRKHSRSYRSR
jgi:hypothetical protein